MALLSGVQPSALVGQLGGAWMIGLPPDELGNTGVVHAAGTCEPSNFDLNRPPMLQKLARESKGLQPAIGDGGALIQFRK